nr:ribosome biogenesis protein WDR12 homolog [Ipomoea batatas]
MPPPRHLLASTATLPRHHDASTAVPPQLPTRTLTPSNRPRLKGKGSKTTGGGGMYSGHENTLMVSVCSSGYLKTSQASGYLRIGPKPLIQRISFKLIWLLISSARAVHVDRDDDWKPEPFDFLIGGELIRMSLEEFLLAKKISAEKISDIEYIKAVAPRREEEPSLQDHWVSAVDGSNSK